MKKLLVGAVGKPCSGKCRKPQERIVSRKFALFSVIVFPFLCRLQGADLRGLRDCFGSKSISRAGDPAVGFSLKLPLNFY